jgi:Methyltransferase domain
MRTKSVLPHDRAEPLSTDERSRFLYRPLAFREPERVVHPPSWLEHIPFAFWIVDVVRPRVFVELGTQSGNSYSAVAQAIKMLGLPAAAYAVDTWRGDEHAGFYDESVFTEWSAYHDQHFGSFSRLIRSTFEEAVQNFDDGAIDLLHVDGCHTYEAASEDFARWRPKLSDRGVVLLHDTNVREGSFGVWKLWEELRTQYPSFEFLHGHGLGVLGVGGEMPPALSWLLSRRTAEAEETVMIRQCFATLGSAISARHAVVEQRRALEAQQAQLPQLQAAIAQQQASAAGLAQELDRVRAELASALADRQQRDATAKDDAERIAGLQQHLAAVQTQLSESDAQRREMDEALRAARQAHDELKGAFDSEAERRARAEAERDAWVHASRWQRLLRR